MAAGKFSVVCVTHFYFIGQQWSRACVQTRLPTGAIKANEQRRFAGAGSEWRKEPRAPFQGQLLLPPADHYHSVKEVVQPEFLSSLTEAKIIQIFVWHLQNLAFLANSSFFLDQIKYISGLNLAISLNFWLRGFTFDFASAFLAPGECYLVTVGIDNISQNSSIRSGGMEGGMQQVEGCVERGGGTGRQVKQFGSSRG